MKGDPGINILIIILFILIGLFLFLFLFNIAKKLYMQYKAGKTAENMESIKPRIELLLDMPEAEFTKELEKFAADARKNTRGYRNVVEDYIMDTLEQPDGIKKERLIAAARRLNFSSGCIPDIRNRNPKISAMGSRRAGLYNLTEAIEDMLNCLDVISSQNQFEILVAFARIGKADPMLRAFEKIKNSVVINERAVMEILALFPNGDEKRKLFRTVVSGDCDYLTTLFLRAVDRQMAELLVYDMVQILFTGSKEVRTAAVKGLATFGAAAPESVLLLAMEDTEWEVRAMAAKALEFITIPEAGEALYKALFDRQWWVRQNAANALVKHPGYGEYFKRAVESGDKYSLDSIIATLEKGYNPDLLDYFKNYKKKETQC